MKYLLRGGPCDDECKPVIGTLPATIQHVGADSTFTYFPTDEVFEQDGEEVTVYEPQETPSGQTA